MLKSEKYIVLQNPDKYIYNNSNFRLRIKPIKPIITIGKYVQWKIYVNQT